MPKHFICPLTGENVKTKPEENNTVPLVLHCLVESGEEIRDEMRRFNLEGLVNTPCICRCLHNVAAAVAASPPPFCFYSLPGQTQEEEE